MRFLELKEKEVINCKDCKRLGYVADIEFDCNTGKVLAIIVPEVGKLFSCFGAGAEYYIRYCDIVKIGPDIVLVDLEPCDICKACEKGKP
ncbi:MAG: YlmC/YmxH family sporulation protein [Eubacteriales bacterium]|nr:YlmC/YmxH family sporulation protein [Lachnospiraceae bacterium]MDO5126203.1 YlmC/YmxH family sporulation protein [Eubacteriales bacterium]